MEGTLLCVPVWILIICVVDAFTCCTYMLESAFLMEAPVIVVME